MAQNIPSLNASRALLNLGGNLRKARLRRRISIADLAQRVGVSGRTITRLEKGDPGVAIGTLAMVCLVLGELDRVSSFLDVGSDDTGLLLDQERLPQRIRGSARREEREDTDEDARIADDPDDDGVGF